MGCNNSQIHPDVVHIDPRNNIQFKLIGLMETHISRHTEMSKLRFVKID